MSPWIFLFCMTLMQGNDSGVEFPQEKFDAYSKSVLSFLKAGDWKLPEATRQESPGHSGASFVFPFRDFAPPEIPISSVDTLVIGDTPGETLTVTGPWFHDGPIFVITDGVLQFDNAQVTNTGDLYVLGSGKVYADSTFFLFPQIYWYERALVIAQDGYLRFDACTTSFNGFPYSMFIGDSARAEINNVYHQDFTTSLVSGKSSLLLNGVNLSGEYIMLDSATADFKNATTLLIWHHFPSNSVINFSFPSGDTVYSYAFDASVPGIDSIGYRVNVDSCYDVLWGMMPTSGSDVEISNSSIRSLGVWFEGSDTINVSGLVNNSTYLDFTAPISDRNLRLINTSVRTWSLYPFDSVRLNVTSCILGEVLALNQTFVALSNYFLDGSGGYLGSTDSSLAISTFCAVSANIRSERSGILLLGYAGVPYGDVLAIGNSLLIVVQSSLPQDPVPLEGSVAWFGNISGPSQGVAGDTLTLMGSAWIDRGPQHTVYDFGQYQMFFQRSGDSLWTSISPPSLVEVRNDALSMWDTWGLNPDNYLVRLILKNNFGDSVDAIKNINLLAVGVEEDLHKDFVESDFQFRVQSQPSKIVLSLSLLNSDQLGITAVDLMGRVVKRIFAGNLQAGEYEFSWIPPVSGVYFIRLNLGEGVSPPPQKIVWLRSRG